MKVNKINKVIKNGIMGAILLSSYSIFAAPVMWEADFGAEIVDLSGEDDAISSVSLSFLFPFAGNSYDEFVVGTNGGIQAIDGFGSAGNDDDIDYDLWADLDEFLGDGSPIFTAFNTDLSLEDNGSIHFNDFGDRAVFTWNEVGTALELDHLASFQIQLLDIGQIIFSYNGIFDGIGEGLFDSLDEGIVTGVSAGDFGPVSTADLSEGTASAPNTVFEQWCFDTADSCEQFSGDTNDTFDLDQMSIIFTPTSSGFEVTEAATSVASPSVIMLSVIGLFAVMRRRLFV